ncbi:oligopeptide transport system ATP-binding protein [Dethiosulfatibacter aminovorans DSM 17477]|uniref:Oligopeptide transport system ATP-binding protein n=1 Tax=Dethiosulfatibacter aminovorans DSM 17477 TaxID=1121476 RepID=A0A1M6FWC4_9FIRM|nr:ABC transporter ATP-binding protein [Dethiosulfatibacter aminovorans]SHJ02011.1 oligopeptide transport system ATP-binding protein [Dethiosulfatibacter aminovorans DSM 17477]
MSEIKKDNDILLHVKNLHVAFDTYAGEVKAVRGVDYELKKGETLAIVGESGCGKSVSAQTIMQLIPMPPGKIKEGEIIFEGKNLLDYSDKEMEKIRGKDISMIFQDPMTSLNPTMKVGKQIMEVLIKHQNMTKSEAHDRAVEMLKLVGLPNPEKRAKQFPHEYSGGMRQRAMIAIALACNPKLLIADEPTTALDVTIQAQIMDLMQELQDKLNTAIILITHDLGVVADSAKKIAVMYAGIIIEYGETNDIFYNAQHPYTWGLLQSVPRLDVETEVRLVPIDGTPPDLIAPPKGCPFAARCDYAMPVCKESMPEVSDVSDNHYVRCWLKHDMAPEVVNPVTGRRD